MSTSDDPDGTLYTERALPASAFPHADVDEPAFEVFARYGGAQKPIAHVGSVRAADPALAWHAAREVYTRREDCSLLWVVPRSAVSPGSAEEQETLQTSQRLTYRLPAFPGAHRRARDEALGR